MVVNDIRLIFDNPQQTFSCGETVCGRLRVCVDAPEKLRSIIVKFKGEANTSWTEEKTVSQDGNKEKVTVHYKDHDLYFENNVRVFGSTGEAEILPRGEHFFQYSMILPDHLPASFEGKYGHIRYSVKGILDNPWKHNHEVVTTITLRANVDLNFDSRYREPIQREESKHMCCCCCRSGPLTLTTHVPYKGYVVGETIPLTVEVDNASNVKISNVMCQLKQIVSYHSTSPDGMKKDKTDVVKFKCEEPVPKHDSRTWEVKLRIPPVQASMLQSCSIIDVYYRMEVITVPRGPHKNLEITFPILIGTIPFVQNVVHHESTSAVAMSMAAAVPSFPTQAMAMTSHVTPMVPQMPVMAMPTAPPPHMGGGYMPLPQQGNDFAPAAPCLYSSPPTYEESVGREVRK